MYSIRRRLMLVLAAGFAVVIAGIALYVADALGAYVVGEFDSALVAKAQALASLTDQEAGRIELDYSADSTPEFERAEKPEYFQFWLDDGTPLLRSRWLDRDLPRAASAAGEPLIRDAQLPDGRAGRIVELAYVPRGARDPDDENEAEAPASGAPVEVHGVVLVVARGREHLDRLLARMRLAVFGGGGIAILLAVLLVWWTFVLGFRPIESIAQQVRRLDADSLSTRVGLTRTPRELAPVVDQLNDLLSRLDASFERERRFAGNVAHELRTPVAELRSLAAVGAKWPGDEAAVVRFFRDVGDIAGRMEGVIANLLLLARCQAGVELASSSPVRLRDACDEAWSKLRSRASETGLRLRMELSDDIVVESDPDKLAIVFANVLGNAVTYARPDSEIGCVATRTGSRFQLDITNAADRLSSDDLRHLAEPFWRKDPARSSDEHAGLGLSLVSALARVLRLRVRFSQDSDGTFCVRLRGRARGAGEPARPSWSLSS